jgi:2-polyprenyl-3-methyl-5-hydroxy-6-metoxy-1,4-benzoquinol methylase
MELEERLTRLVGEFPEVMHRRQLGDIPRVAFHLKLALAGREPSKLAICDVGGGLGLFIVACAALGAQATLIDDFRDDAHLRIGEQVLEVYRRYGVETISRDVVADGLGGYDGAFDTITAFATMEHWHHSPKKVFHQMTDALRPQGRFILSAPNCLNIRKRISWVLGTGYWSHIRDWYEPEVFRGHVREPSISDMRYIARDLALRDVCIYGRNWAGYASPSRARRLITPLVDRPLRLRPSLCSTLYLVGSKL